MFARLTHIKSIVKHRWRLILHGTLVRAIRGAECDTTVVAILWCQQTAKTIWERIGFFTHLRLKERSVYGDKLIQVVLLAEIRHGNRHVPAQFVGVGSPSLGINEPQAVRAGLEEWDEVTVDHGA